MGFEPQIRDILEQVPTHAMHRQTLFFTATWPREVQSLASEFLHKPVQINIGDSDTLNANKAIKQHILCLKEFEKPEALMSLLESVNPNPSNPRSVGKTVIFVGRKAAADDLEFELRAAGYSAGALHGDKSQMQRDGAMEKFRAGRLGILVATDVAARGIDVKVSWLIDW